MKISLVIQELTAILEEHGDMPFLVTVDGFGGHAEYTAKNLHFGGMYCSTDELLNELQLDEEVVQEFFPEYNGTACDGDVNTVTLSCGDMLSTT